ncbi:phosphatidylinositol alpha 1,6-mannosyltransferase [Methylophilaceae bacterium]|nr:phosphatidylinositol alpha 1,6-mannosyltransferase [Methylophilaceae bacterium]
MNMLHEPADIVPNTSSQYLVLVTETWPPEINGVAMTLNRLIQGMLARNWRVSVVRPRQRDDNAPDNRQQIQHILVPGVPIPGYAGLRFGLPMFEKLREAWKRQRPDVVHIATEGPLGWAALKAARMLGIPVTSSFHTNFHRYCKYYKAGWLRGLITRHLREFHNQTALTMAPNVLLRQTLQDEDYRNVVVLGRGIDTGLFSPRRRSRNLRETWGLGEDGLAVIYVGRMAAEKSLGVVVKAFNAIRMQNPDAKMVWVGDGPELRKLRKRHPDHVFCGAQIGGALADHYASADMFLFPSMTETFGNVVTEAMASGLAVVAYDYAAAEMFVRPDENGLLVTYGDQKQFVERAAALAGDRERLRQLGHGASKAVDGHSWDHVCDQFAAYLHQARNPLPSIPVP